MGIGEKGEEGHAGDTRVGKGEERITQKRGKEGNLEGAREEYEKEWPEGAREGKGRAMSQRGKRDIRMPRRGRREEIMEKVKEGERLCASRKPPRRKTLQRRVQKRSGKREDVHASSKCDTRAPHVVVRGVLTQSPPPLPPPQHPHHVGLLPRHGGVHHARVGAVGSVLGLPEARQGREEGQGEGKKKTCT